MSAIRPSLPSPMFPAQVPTSPARASRSDFFRAALDGLKAPESTALAPVDTPVRAMPRSQMAEAPDVFARPGSLLDIRV